MKLRAIRWIALIIGSLLAALSLLILISLIDDGIKDGKDINFQYFQSGPWLFFILPPLLMLIVWFRNRWGAFLLILYPFVALLHPEIEWGNELWMAFSAPFGIVGVLLLFYLDYNKKSIL